MASTQQRLGVLLVEMGFIDDAQLGRALDVQQASGRRLGKVLVEAGLITEDRLVHALSRQLGIEACDPIMTPVHDAVLAMVPPEVAFTHRVLPVARQKGPEGESVYVATADPLDSNAMAALKEVLPDNAELRFMLAGETEMDLALARHYGAAPKRTAPVPTGTPVIQGSPMRQVPPQEMATTGDIFTALQQAVDQAIPSEQASTQVEVPVAPRNSGDLQPINTEDFPTIPPVTAVVTEEPSIDFSSGDMVMTASGDVVPSGIPQSADVILGTADMVPVSGDVDVASADVILGTADMASADVIMGTPDIPPMEDVSPSADLLVPNARAVADEVQVVAASEPPAPEPEPPAPAPEPEPPALEPVAAELLTEPPQVVEAPIPVPELVPEESFVPRAEPEAEPEPEDPPVAAPKKPRPSTVASSWGDLVSPSDEPAPSDQVEVSEPAEEPAIEFEESEPAEPASEPDAPSGISHDLAAIGELSTDLPVADASLAAGLDIPAAPVPVIQEEVLEELHDVVPLDQSSAELPMLEPEDVAAAIQSQEAAAVSEPPAAVQADDLLDAVAPEAEPEALMVPDPVEEEEGPATQVPGAAEKRTLEATRTFHRLEAFARGESIDVMGMEDVLRALVRVLLDANVITRQRVEDVFPEEP